MHPHLETRGNTHWYRRKIPLDLLPVYNGKKEFRHSLHTRDRSEAIRRARLRSVELDSEFELKRRGLQTTHVALPVFRNVELSDEQIRRICLLWQRSVLETDDRNRVGGFDFIDFDELSENIEDIEPALKHALARGQLDVIRPALNGFLYLCRIRVDEASSAYKRLQYQFLQMLIETTDCQKRRQHGEVVRTDAVAPIDQVFKLDAADVTKKDAFSLDDLFNLWKEQVPDRPPATLAAFETAIKQFKEFVGDKPILRIDRKLVLSFRDELLQQVKLNPKTVETKLALLSAMFQAAMDSEKLEINPAARIKVPQPKVEPIVRVPYDVEDLQRIFASPIYAVDTPRAGGGAAALWLPPLALFTGARLEELAQLLVADVVDDPNHGWYFRITDIPDGEASSSGEKRVKTSSSRRRVPIHRALIDAGFLRYVERCKREGHTRLFPQLKPDCKGKWSGNWSKWWSRYSRKTIGIVSSLKVFHSLRHNFKDICREVEIEEAVHDALTGHSGGGVGRQYGGKLYPLAPLFKAMRKIKYSGVTLPLLEP